MRVVDFIACDDVRHEIGNKFSLMGTFTDLIVMREEVVWPIQMMLSVLARVALDPEDVHPDQFVMTVASETDTGEMKEVARAVSAAVAPASGRLLNFIVSLRPLAILGPGSLDFKLDVLRDGKPAIESFAYKMRVIPFAPPSPTAP